MLICILALSLVFTPYLSNAVVSAKSPQNFHALVALKLLVSLISRLVACSARIVIDRQTDKHAVTLAAHARRGLIGDKFLIIEPSHFRVYYVTEVKHTYTFRCYGEVVRSS